MKETPIWESFIEMLVMATIMGAILFGLLSLFGCAITPEHTGGVGWR